jgi:hypothetical protein
MSAKLRLLVAPLGCPRLEAPFCLSVAAQLYQHYCATLTYSRAHQLLVCAWACVYVGLHACVRVIDCSSQLAVNLAALLLAA